MNPDSMRQSSEQRGTPSTRRMTSERRRVRVTDEGSPIRSTVVSRSQTPTSTPEGPPPSQHRRHRHQPVTNLTPLLPSKDEEKPAEDEIGVAITSDDRKVSVAHQTSGFKPIQDAAAPASSLALSSGGTDGLATVGVASDNKVKPKRSILRMLKTSSMANLVKSTLKRPKEPKWEMVTSTSEPKRESLVSRSSPHAPTVAASHPEPNTPSNDVSDHTVTSPDQVRRMGTITRVLSQVSSHPATDDITEDPTEAQAAGMHLAEAVLSIYEDSVTAKASANRAEKAAQQAKEELSKVAEMTSKIEALDKKIRHHLEKAKEYSLASIDAARQARIHEQRVRAYMPTANNAVREAQEHVERAFSHSAASDNAAQPEMLDNAVHTITRFSRDMVQNMEEQQQQRADENVGASPSSSSSADRPSAVALGKRPAK